MNIDEARSGIATVDLSIVIPVYRNAAGAARLVRALHRCNFDAARTEIIVVDDGSCDGTAQELARDLAGMARVHALADNAGRAGARNSGANLANGDRILFMDCDCLPSDQDFINSHLQAWATDVVASTGAVEGTGDGFWHLYQLQASQRRSRQHASGMTFSGSSQNMMVSRRAFTACGGFDTAYRTYGFEDRELLLQIGRLGPVVWAETASVRHMDDLTLPTVCHKMIEAGGGASLLFSQRHPEAYQALGYSMLDVRRHRWLRAPALLVAPAIDPAARLADRLLASPLLPYRLKSGLVKILSALSYMVGTSRQPAAC